MVISTIHVQVDLVLCTNWSLSRHVPAVGILRAGLRACGPWAVGYCTIGVSKALVVISFAQATNPKCEYHEHKKLISIDQHHLLTTWAPVDIFTCLVADDTVSALDKTSFC